MAIDNQDHSIRNSEMLKWTLGFQIVIQKPHETIGGEADNYSLWSNVFFQIQNMKPYFTGIQSEIDPTSVAFLHF